MGLRELSGILWRERQLLELLLFKLEEEQLLLAAARTRWLPRATKEVEMVLDEIKYTELERAVELERVATELGLGQALSLRQLSEGAPTPWDGMFAEHRAAFLALTEEIVGLVQTNRELLSRGQAAVREVMASLDEGRGEANVYGPGKVVDLKPNRPFLIDEAM